GVEAFGVRDLIDEAALFQRAQECRPERHQRPLPAAISARRRSRYSAQRSVNSSILPSKKWLAPSTICCSMVMPFCVLSLSTSFCTELGGATRSLSPWMISPDDGQGARKEKS